MSLFLRQDWGSHPSLCQYFMVCPPYAILLLSCCLLLKSLNRQPDTAKWAVHLNQNCWPSGIRFEKRTQVGCTNKYPDSPPWPPMRQKKIHCQGDDWEGLLSALVMGCDYRVLWAAFPVPISRCLSVWKHQPLSSSPWRQLQIPGAEGRGELQLLYPSPVTLVLTEQKYHQQCLYVCIGYTLRWLAWEFHKTVLTQASPFLNLFFAHEAFHNKHSAKAALNLLK